MTPFDEQVELIATSKTNPTESAAYLYSQLTPDDRLWLLDGDSTAKEFAARFVWEGYGYRPHNGGIVGRMGIPGIRFTDGPRGILMGHDCTAFPTSSTRACTWDPRLEEEVVRLSSAFPSRKNRLVLITGDTLAGPGDG